MTIESGRSAESEPPMMDFIAWVWMGRPVAADLPLTIRRRTYAS